MTVTGACWNRIREHSPVGTLRRTHIRCLNDRERQKEARTLSKRVEQILLAFADETKHPAVQKAHAQFRADHALLLL